MRLDNISMDELSNQYEKEYTALYESSDEKNVDGYSNALEKGMTFFNEHGDFVGNFARYIGDCVASDREVVAFMFALKALDAEY